MIVTTDLTASLLEDADDGMPIIYIDFSDLDIGENNQLNYIITSQGGQANPFSLDSINATRALLILADNSTIDFESQKIYEIECEVSDNGSPSRTSTFTITVNIDDVDDNPPLFVSPSYSKMVPEGTQVGVSLLSVTAQDVDTVDVSFIYKFSNITNTSNFIIDSLNGTIYLNYPLDYETQPIYVLIVQVCDISNGNVVTDTTNVTIYVTEVNDIPPEFTNPTPVTFTLNEGDYTNNPECVLTLTVMDKDQSPNSTLVQCTLYAPFSGFTVMHMDLPDHQYTYCNICAIGVFDYETFTSGFFSVTASDTFGIDSIYVTFSIIDIIDEAPYFLNPFYSAMVFENSMDTTIVITVRAEDSELGTVLTYAIDEFIDPPIGFFEILSSGRIVVKGILDFEEYKTHNFTVSCIFFIFRHQN